MKLINTLRKQLKLTQKDFAAILGRSVRTIQRWQIEGKRLDEKMVVKAYSHWIGSNGTNSGDAGVVENVSDPKAINRRNLTAGNNRSGRR